LKEEIMANGTRTLTLVIVLIVGIAVGWFIGRGQAPPPTPPQPTPVPTVVGPPPTPVPTPVCPPQVTPVAKAKDWKLTVGPEPCDVKEDGQAVTYAVISREKGHKIVFQSSGGEALAIIVHVAQGSPRPFKNMAFVGNDPQGLAQWALFCDDPKKPCSTGPAQKDATYGCYKYDQVLNGKRCDAGIIIQP